MREAHPLAPLIEKIEAHYRRFRSKTYKGLVKSGKAKAHFQRLAEWRQEKLYEYQDRGLNYAEATGLVDQGAFPPSEEDEERQQREYVDPGNILPVEGLYVGSKTGASLCESCLTRWVQAGRATWSGGF